jgi:predicted phosphodiesterase
MRILIISDVHANPWALAAVEHEAGSFDHVIFAGDSVNYGPAPREAVRWLRERHVTGVRGNHDHAVVCGADPRVSPTKKRLAQAMGDWTHGQLEVCDIEWLSSLPIWCACEFGGLKFSIHHATPREPLYDYHLTPTASEKLLEELFKDENADVIVTGHTHLPFLREYSRTRLCNPGSVGQPLDGDPRAAYAVWEDGLLELRRAQYDRAPLLHAIATLPLEGSLRMDLAQIIRSARIGSDGKT